MYVIGHENPTMNGCSVLFSTLCQPVSVGCQISITGENVGLLCPFTLTP